MKWQESELNYLRSNYKKLSLTDLKDYLYIYFWNDRTISSIKVKAHRMGLKRFSND